MIVTNATWQLAGAGADESLVIQNTGITRIGFVFAAAQPAVDDYTLDSDEHFMLNPGSEPITIKDLDTYTKNVYVRSIGPIDGKLAVEANSAVPAV